MPINESSVLVRLRLLGGARFAAETKGVTRSMAAMRAESMGLSGRLGKLRSTMSGVGAAFVGGAKFIGGTALALGAAGGEAAHMAMNFEQAMLMIHTQAGASMSEVKDLSKQVLDLSKIEPQGPQELANALYRLEGAGIRGSEAMKGLKAAADLATVGNANVEDTAKTLSQVWFSGIKGAGDFNKVVAEINATVGAGDMRLQQLVDALGVGIMPVAKNAGLAMRDITGALAVFGDETNNVSGWTAQLATALHYLYAPTKKGEAAMEGIGITGTDLAKDFRKKNGLLVAMKDLRSHLDKLPGGFRGIKGAQTLAEILPGGRGRVLNVLLGQLDRYQQKLKQIGGTTNRFAEANKKAHDLAINKIKSAWSSVQAALINIGGSLVPIITPAVTGTLNGLASIINKMHDVGQAMKPFKDAFKAGFDAKNVQAVSGYGGALGKAAKAGALLGKATHHAGAGFKAGVHAKNTSEIQGFTGGAGVAAKAGLLLHKGIGLIGPAFKGASKWAGQFIAALKPAAPFFSNVLLPFIKGLTMGLVGGLAFAFKMIIPIVKIVATALGFVGKVMAPLKPLFVGLGAVVGFVFGGEILDAMALLGKFGFVFRILSGVIRTVNGAFRIGAGVVGRLIGVFGRAFTWFQRFIGTFSSAPARFIRAATNIVGGIMHGMSSLPGRVGAMWWKAVSKIAGTYASVYKKLGSFAWKIGKGIVHGIVSAIKAAPGAIVGAISSIIPGPLKSVLRKAGGAVGALGDLVGHAAGGYVRSPLQVVGEQGPELTAMPRGSRVFTASETRGMMRSARSSVSGGGALLAHLHVHLSGKQIHHEVVRVERGALEMA